MAILSLISFLVMAEFVLGNLANGFIALVNCKDWVKRQKISLVDQMLTALAVSRISLLWVVLIYWLVIMFNPALFCFKKIIYIHIAWTTSTHFNIWFTAGLSIIYLLKIVNFSSFLFLYLKQRVKTVLLKLLLGSLIFLIMQLASLSIHENMIINENEGNVTWKAEFRHIVKASHWTIHLLVKLIPFTMSVTSFVLLIFSLWKHLKKVQLRGQGCQDVSTQIHVRALKTLFTFLFLYVIYFLEVIFSIWNINKLLNKPVQMIYTALFILYPSGHSIFLIWGNRKLKQAFLSFLWKLRFPLRGSE